MMTDGEYGFLLNDELLRVRFPVTEPLQCLLCRTLVTSETFLKKHAAQAHPETRCRWVCLRCETEFVSHQSLKCHIPKCRGIKEVAGSHICGMCNRSFTSQRGLSLHKRSRHPDLRNAEQLEALEPPQCPSVRRQSIWTQDEIATLKRLEEQFRDDPHINVKIAVYLPLKTHKQVSNFRCEDRKRSLRTQAAGDDGTAGPDALLPLGLSPADDGSGNREEPPIPTNDKPSQILSPGDSASALADILPPLLTSGTSLDEPQSDGPAEPVDTSLEPLVGEGGVEMGEAGNETFAQSSPLFSEGSDGNVGSTPSGVSADLLLREQVPTVGTDDPNFTHFTDFSAFNISSSVLPAEQTNTYSKVRVDDRRKSHTCPAANVKEQDASAPHIEEQLASDDPAVQLGAWRKRVALHALSIDAGVLSSPIDALLRKISDLGNEQTPPGVREEVEAVVSLVTREISGGAPPIKRTPKKKRKQKDNRDNHRGRKRQLFAICQDTFKKHPQRLAEWAVGEQTTATLYDHQTERPAHESFHSFLAGLWGKSGRCDITMPPSASRRTDAVLNFITVKEIKQRLKRIKKGSAPGPDGITKEMVQSTKKHCEILAKLFNLVMLAGFFPRSWKENRTTLIHKSGTKPADVGNWRPITIGSLLSRLFTGFVDTRLRTVVDVHERQVGFMPTNGCSVNSYLLDEILHEAKRGERAMVCGALLDISKAFDTIPHEAIMGALHSQGVDAHSIALIKDMYMDTCTKIDGVGDGVPLQRGVKQGDSLSPLLFNLVMDPLIRNLQGGLVLNGQQVGALAFADDLVVVADTTVGAQTLLDRTHEYLAGLGMKLNPSKSRSFLVEAGRKTWVVRDAKLSLGGETVPGADPSTPLRYLGLSYTLAKGLNDKSQCEKLVQAVERVKSLALKPLQKVRLIITYIYPKFTYGMVLNDISKKVLGETDRKIRQDLKEILHLHPSTTDHVLYSRMRDGGLGIPRLQTHVAFSSLKAGMTLSKSVDPVMRASLDGGRLEMRLRKLANGLRLNFPLTPNALVRARNQMKEKEAEDWCALNSQGQGVPNFRNDPIVNSWLYDPSVLRPKRFIDALKLRTNTYGVNVTLARADKNRNVACRRCHEKPETLGHVLGECVAGKGMRINRHNAIVERIAEESTKRGYVVAREPEHLVEERRLKPDLVLTNEEGVLVVDVTVRYENGSSLYDAHQEKVSKYRALAENLAGGQGRIAKVLPIVIGSRGAIPFETRDCLTTLGVVGRLRLEKYLSLLALGSSLDIVYAHLDYT